MIPTLREHPPIMKIIAGEPGHGWAIAQRIIGRTITVALVALGWPASATADPGTREDRAALFDYILEATMERTAFSPFKPRDIGAGEHVTEAEYVRSAMLAHRDEFLAADTDAKLYYALTKLTCARWDGHLSRVRLVEGGIQPFAGRTQTGGAAPIKFKPDYTNRATMFLFVSDFAKDIARMAGPNARRTPQLGDKLVGVNVSPAFGSLSPGARPGVSAWRRTRCRCW